MPPVVYLLGLTVFAMTTAEFMVAGMMPALANAMQVGIGDIGNLISLYALGMTIGGPVLTALLLALRTPHKRALIWLLTINVAGGVLAAVSTRYEVMALARIIMGVASSATFGVALTLCADLVAPSVRGRAASFVLGGLMFSPVVGVPLTAYIEQHYGWRASFWLVALLAALCTVAVALWAPASKQQDRETVSLAAEFRSLLNRPLWAAFATSGLIIGATFAAFSYFSPIFMNVAGVSAAAIPNLLAMYGIANIIGNAVIGRLADRHTLTVLVGGLSVLALALISFALWADLTPVGIAAFAAIGLTGVSLNPAMVARVMRAAAPGPLVNTMHTSVITAGLAFGTWAGGAAIDAGYSMRAPLWIGAAMAALGLASLLPYLRSGLAQAPDTACPAS
ncbi:MFS transporter [Pandoraea apista]|uniref:MFS transporter n=3 Tax=Pandoraea apista TaxID=93218 RepID=A0ABX9ZJK1_9BURK|nr:MFS transporter [Pandoraea apista]AVF42320.1 MFS transporter [Pandoraea apista]PTD98605.1 MFS transporter [Pandoraea apista]RRJ27720.1 MFS transporter [Pandoraea apista]RRJ73232.1 MFS transporter [Pandoraea apista]RRW97203.1 MFS transporter [Pandoraea apista]